MSAETAAYSTLSADATVSGMVGERIYPDFVPLERDIPAIAFARDSTQYTTTIHSDTPLYAVAHLDIWCIAATRLAAESLADAAVAALVPVEFRVINRHPEADAELGQFVTVVTVEFWE